MSSFIGLIPEASTVPLNRPCIRVYDHAITLDGVKLHPGVWRHTSERDQDGNEIADNVWLCGPLYVDGLTRCKAKNANYGRLLRFRNLDGTWVTWVMPAELLAGRADAILAPLFDMGLAINQHRRSEIVNYIAEQTPERRVMTVTTTGWHGKELFVTPLENIGEGDAIYQADSETESGYSKGGTLDGWREGVAAMLPGNPLLQLGIGTALAGPLLAPLSIYAGGGVHLLGDSSSGKTTIVECAASAWGHGTCFTLKWNATANGLEGIAALRNDSLLVLDELGQADPRYVGDVVYSLADGIGRQRAGRTGSARTTKRWRSMLLSSGEVTLETKMREADKCIRAGQEVRLVTVSGARTFGVWDNLHGHPNGASLTDALKLASSTHYGHAGPEFVRQLIESGDLEQLPEMLEMIRAHFPAPPGQPARVAERLAIIALALELAAGMGLLPLAQGEGTTSMAGIFETWSGERGEGPSEDRHILRAITDFIDRHGGTRFQALEVGASEVRDRAGYREMTATGPLYLFTSSGLAEAAPNIELTRVVRALDSVGAIAKRKQGKNQAEKRLPDGSKKYLYFIDPARLEPAP